MDDFAGLIALSATPRKLAPPGILHPGGRRRTARSLESAAKNRIRGINDGDARFDPESRGEMSAISADRAETCCGAASRCVQRWRARQYHQVNQIDKRTRRDRDLA
ncbi:hypothetical protein [Bradyrhizobium monzae]|uniref:hypothetical protein n=1 Tax=Bradyrhizobium sp. Oc8 TaxID=2876780 RepID=UPI001F3A21F9|nr:hypothetical protein [Bradyrhizobium sp. Oc8]